MLQTNTTGVCTQYLSHSWPAPARGAHHSGSTLLSLEPSEAALGLALRGADSVGPAFCALPRSA